MAPVVTAAPPTKPANPAAATRIEIPLKRNICKSPATIGRADLASSPSVLVSDVSSASYLLTPRAIDNADRAIMKPIKAAQRNRRLQPQHRNAPTPATTARIANQKKKTATSGAQRMVPSINSDP